MIRRLRRSIRLPNPFYAFRRLWVALANRRRRRFKQLDTLLLTLPGALPALPQSRGWLLRRVIGASPLSLWELDRIFERIADDPRPKGIVLTISSVALPLADLQTLRASILKLRARGKRVICFSQSYGLGQYYLASACDQIVLQPGGELATTGLRDEVVFLKDALATVGISLDVVAISPFKGAYDQLTRADISPEARMQLEWLLDSRYDQLLDGIAEGRGWTRAQAERLIDTAPHLDRDALAAGYVDAVLNEEGLPGLLETKNLVPWSEAESKLFAKVRRPHDRYVALLSISGMMMLGESGGPPGGLPLPIPFIGGARAGDRTIVRRVRSLMKDSDAAAVILFVDSPGGVAIAAEAMTSALDELAKTRPVVVYMNAVAASGGYYVATAGQWIVAQPGTVTGSIGVVTAKPVTGGLLEKLHANAVEITRGANASLYSEREPFTEAQRAQVRRSIEHIYALFLERVARSRHMTTEAVDAVGGGRVWTGAQAKIHGLVDELGTLETALVKARSLANLPDDAPLLVFEGKARPLPPQLAETTIPGAALRYLNDNLRALSTGAQVLLPFYVRTED